MSLHRRAAKRDQSEREIILALLIRGWSVLQVSVKDGPDLVAAKWQRTYPRVVFIECKTGTRKLKPGQVRWAETWPGETATLRTAEEALAL